MRQWWILWRWKLDCHLKRREKFLQCFETSFQAQLLFWANLMTIRSLKISHFIKAKLMKRWWHRCQWYRMNYDIDFLFVKALQAELYPCNLSGHLFREKVCLRHRENRPTTTDQRPPTGPTTGDRLYKWPLFTSIHKLVVASLQEINSPSYPDMVFVKNLQPQFWENDFTHKKCVNWDIIEFASEQLKYFQSL